MMDGQDLVRFAAGHLATLVALGVVAVGAVSALAFLALLTLKRELREISVTLGPFQLLIKTKETK